MRIRPRLTLYAVGVAAVGLLLSAVVLLVLARGGAASELDEALQGTAVALAERVTTAGTDTLRDDPPSPPHLEPIDVPVVLLALAPDGRPIWSSDPSSTLRVPASAIVEALDLGSSLVTTGAGDGTDTRVAVVAWHRSDGSGLAVAARTMAALDRQMRDLQGFLVVSALIALVAVGVATWIVIGRALRPLRTLTTTADGIAASGDATLRLPVDRHRDEVGALTRSFNAMLGRLDASRRELSGSLEAQRRMVADASHELRTPLTTIRTNAETLRAHPDGDPGDRVAAVEDIASEAARMSRLLDDLLLLARADAERPIIGPRRPVDLGALATEVARKASTPERPVARRPIRETCVVDGDPDALERLVWILVDNALRHAAGDVTLTLDHTTDPSPMCRLTVDDEGSGFLPGDEERAFDRFWRADRSRSGPGAGLGLAIARSIVQSHDGTIDARTRTEGGARIVVLLPDATASGSA